MFHEHHASVRRYALRRAAPETAQDAVAETFLVAWRRFDDVPADALPWLYAVARRTLANQRRSAARGEALAERLATADSGAVADFADAVDDADAVRLALGRLTESDREALMLVAWDGLSGRRAALAAGCTHMAFKVRLHRARSRLAAALSELDGRIAPAPRNDSMEVR